MSRWPLVTMGDIAPIVRREAAIVADGLYPELGIRSFGKGAFHKPAVEGHAIGTKRLFEIKPGDLLFSNVFAWEGAVAVASKNDQGRYGSHRFISCVCDQSKALAEYLRAYFVTPAGIEQLGKASPGGAGRNRTLGIEKLARIEIPLPPLAEQQAIVTRLDALADKSERLTAHWQAIADDAAALLAMRFAELIADAPRRPLGEVAPLLRRPIEINDEQSYTELGIKSFYKGAFRRRTVSGSEFTWQKMFAVNEGDLMFSNIMAWEQAIAVAGPEHAGCITNHRMLICDVDRTLADPSFLWFYFTTAQGFTGITAASPGTAARNKTLNPEALQAIPVPLPPLAQQQAFNQLQSKVAALLAEQIAQREQLEQLRKQALEQAFA